MLPVQSDVDDCCRSKVSRYRYSKVQVLFLPVQYYMYTPAGITSDHNYTGGAEFWLVW